MMRLATIALWTRGRLLSDEANSGDVEVRGITIDTRKIAPGELFVAMVGAHVDGHDYVAAAAAKGAVAALVTRKVDAPIAQVLVKDATIALGDLASAVRAQRDVRVVGITGSNGKTTVKTLTASILARHGRTHVNSGNYNNELGLPLTLLAMPADTEYAVLEMGAGKPGDIAYLAAIARPDIGLVNTIAPAHLARMGSVEGIAETKGALYQALPVDGVAIINADDAFAPFFTGLAGNRRQLRFGLAQSSLNQACLNQADLDRATDIGADIVEQRVDGSRFMLRMPHGKAEINLPLPGRHNIANALAAATIAWALDVPLRTIVDGLRHVPAVPGRLHREAMPGGWTLIDDSYNANPGSTAAAIDTLALAVGERWLVLGDMGELGAEARTLHERIGALARERGIEKLFAVGPLSAASVTAFGAGGTHFVKQSELIDGLRARLHGEVTCLIKGSRSAGMDHVAQALRQTAGGASHAA